MNSIENILKKPDLSADTFTPKIFNCGLEKDRRNIKKLYAQKRIQTIRDDYSEQLQELFAVDNPHLVYTPTFLDSFKQYFKELSARAPLWHHGRWIFYPWLNTLVHVLEDKNFQRIRTARNRYLIDPAEQEKFYNATIGIGGLSVGNSVALAIVLQGGGRHIKLADFDRLSLSNTNRVRAGVQNLGLRKVVITARQIYEINPYSKVEIFPEGLNKNSIHKFFAGTPKLDIVIDELDNLSVKYLIREQAKKHRLAVVMGADNGDNAVVDVERYDLNPKIKFFHGRIGNVTFDSLAKLDKFGIGKTITQHIGPENVTGKMQHSLLEMGKTIVSWPQLGGAATLNGSAVAYCVRKILNGQPLEQNRSLVSLDELFIPGYNSPVQKKQRKKVSDSFKKMFGLK